MNRLARLIIWPILAAPVIYLVVIWDKLPARVPVHFNFKGEADRFGSKNEFLLVTGILLATAILLYLLLPLVYKIDPKKTAIGNKTRLQRLAFVIASFLSLLTCAIINAVERGNFKFDINFVFGSIGLLLCITGNYIYNIKPNYFAGFRLPWTLENEENWRKTHLLGGKIFFSGGLLIILASLLVSGGILFALFLFIMISMILIPCIYSYLFYKKKLNE